MKVLFRLFAALLIAATLGAVMLRADAALRAAEEKAKAAVAGEPVTAWIEASQLGADGQITPGAALRDSGDAAAAVVGSYKSGDAFAIQRIQGDWVQIRVYAPGTQPPAPVAVAPVVAAPAPVAPIQEAPVAVAPTAPSASVVTSPSAPVLLPDDFVPVRTFSGTLERTRGFIWTTPPSKFELIDKDGYRVAFLNLSTLMKTVDIERAVGRPVQVSGTVVAIRRGKDVLMTVESLVLR
jgi:hypothetical protein